MEASRAERPGGYLDLSKLSPGEYMGMAAAVVLFLSLFLPWFTTSDSNPNSTLGYGITGGDSASAWQVFSTLDFLLAAGLQRARSSSRGSWRVGTSSPGSRARSRWSWA